MLDYMLLTAVLALSQPGPAEPKSDFSTVPPGTTPARIRIPGLLLSPIAPARAPADAVVPVDFFAVSPGLSTNDPVRVGEQPPQGTPVKQPGTIKINAPLLPGPTAQVEPAPAPIEVPAPLLPLPAPPPAPAAAAAPAAVPPDRWLLMKELQGTWAGNVLDGNRTAIYGWVDANITAGSAGHNNLPETWNYRANEPVMQQLWARINRSVLTTGTNDPTFGYQADLLFGTDYRFSLPQRGILVEQLAERDGLPNIYGFDPIQFYGEAYFPTICRGLDVKVGRFYTPYGVESVEAVSTPLVSHSYVFSNGSPVTHTGVLGTLTVTPVWTVQGGVVLGSDVFIDPADEATGIGTVQWTQPGGRNVVKLTTIFGPGHFNSDRGVQNINVMDMVWTHTFNPILVYNLEVLGGYERNVPDQTLADGSNAQLGTITWAGVVNYLSYTFSPRVIGTTRLEFFDDPQGFRTLLAPGATVGDTKGVYTALTVGCTVKLTDPVASSRGSIIFLPELRYDYNGESRPFNGNHSLLTAAGSFIVRW